ncbi:MAG: DHH family phosphoesterase [Eggerthellaceae bacterium]|nr:DHH family phosphoesterase [Eggerthellaceae bacterium]
MAVTPQTNATMEEIAQVIREGSSFVLCGHVGPDADCIGSQLSLWHALKALGKQATCVLVKDVPLPAGLSFMPGAEEMIPAERYQGTPDVFLGIDVPVRGRIGEAACSILDGAATSITIDHHSSNERMCDYAYIDPDSASASILVWEVVKLLCENPPVESAYCAYAGLVGDTGGFRYQNSDAVAFRAASELVTYDFDPASVASHLYQSRTLASVKLAAPAIEHMVINAEGTYALSWVTIEDLQAVEAQESDTEPLIDVLRSLAGIRVACMMREKEDEVRVSLRAKDDTDVSVLARELGGGGHCAAAGLTLHLPIDGAIALMLEKLDALVKTGPED